MKKVVLTFLLTSLFCLSVSAQKISEPTLTPTDPTSDQEYLIGLANGLRKAKKYDEAVEKLKQVLGQNKDCVAALYELGLAYYNNKKLDEALEVSLIGTRYKSHLLPLFYSNVASILDDQGNHERAIGIYIDAITILKRGNGGDSQLSSLHFNLGITYVRQKMYAESREQLKRSIDYDYSYASPNYIISVVFDTTNYRVPALLAAGRFIALEQGTQRSKGAAQIFTKSLEGNVQKGDKPNSINIFVNSNAPVDEGDFGSIELFLGLSKAGSESLEKNKNKTAEEKFVNQVESFVNLFLEQADKKLKNTFVGRNYAPFYAEIKRKRQIEAFSYLVLRETGNGKADAWIEKNGDKVNDLLLWSKTFAFSKK